MLISCTGKYFEDIFIEDILRIWILMWWYSARVDLGTSCCQWLQARSPMPPRHIAPCQHSTTLFLVTIYICTIPSHYLHLYLVKTPQKYLLFFATLYMMFLCGGKFDVYICWHGQTYTESALFHFRDQIRTSDGVLVRYYNTPLLFFASQQINKSGHQLVPLLCLCSPL